MQVNPSTHLYSTITKVAPINQTLQVLHSSNPLNWPGVMVKHFASHSFSGIVDISPSPDYLLVINLSQTQAGTNNQFGFFSSTPFFKKGNISFIPANHKLSFTCKPNSHYLYVQVHSGLWNRLLEKVLGTNTNRVDIKSFTWIEEAFIEDILLKLFTELHHGGKGSRLYVESLTQTLVVYLFRHYLIYKEFPNTTEGLPAFKLKKVLTFMQENLYEKITLQDLSTLIGLSTFHFSRLFKACTGLAPYQYITKMRIEHSQRLLLETDLPIIQIGLEVGIENPSHFSSFFKQYAGVTPTVYRKSLGQ